MKSNVRKFLVAALCALSLTVPTSPAHAVLTGFEVDDTSDSVGFIISGIFFMSTKTLLGIWFGLFMNNPTEAVSSMATRLQSAEYGASVEDAQNVATVLYNDLKAHRDAGKTGVIIIPDSKLMKVAPTFVQSPGYAKLKSDQFKAVVGADVEVK